jgi:hypothetical protein
MGQAISKIAGGGQGGSGGGGNMISQLIGGVLGALI